MPKKQPATPEQMKHSAKMILAARASRDISQRELSKRLGVTQPLVSSWEKAKTIPSLVHIISIESALQMNKGELLMAIAYGDSQQG